MKQTNFCIGDTVVVTDVGYGCGHYLRKGAVVTILHIDGFLHINGFSVNATVQGDASSFKDGQGGWESALYGKHCQCVSLDQVAHIDRCFSDISTYSHPKLPII